MEQVEPIEGQTPVFTGVTNRFTLSSMLMPVLEDCSPVMLRFPGDSYCYIPLWNNEVDLRYVLYLVNAPWDVIKIITDGQEFLKSIQDSPRIEPLRIAVNIRFLPNGRQRFHMIDPYAFY